MEKRLLTILSLLLTAVAVSAGPVTRQAAQGKARNFMQKHGMSLKAAPAHVAKRANGDAAYYVYNSSDGRGFVVIAGDDRATDVLGYADEGTFDAATMPGNMRAWLNGYAAELDAADAAAAAPALAGEEPERENVPTLMSTLWNQNEPYNRLCPSNNGSRTYTGCVATALAQIMKYYRYPTRPTKPIAGYRFMGYNQYFWSDFHTDGLPDTTFAYSKMRNYYTGSEAAAQKDAVALLMQYAGYAVQMVYGTASSGASIGSPVTALQEYFDYDSNTRLVARSDYSAAQWDELIYTEMAAGRPVLMSGVADDGQGHEFVCDGYRSGLYHFNWGWGGYCNGYFRLSALTPRGSGIGGSSAIADGYNQSVMAVVGIQPNTHSGEATAPAPVCSSFYYDGEYVRMTLTGYQSQAVSYAIGIGYYEEDGTLVQISNLVTNLLHDGVAYSFPYAIDLIRWKCNQTDRVYKIVPIYAVIEGGANGTAAPDDTEWKSCAPYGAYLTFSSDASGLTQVDRYPKTDISVKGVSISGPLMARAQVTARVVLHNNGDEFNDNISLYVAAPGCVPMLADGSNYVVGAGDEQTVTFTFTPMREGTYTVYTVYGRDGDILNQTPVEIKGTGHTYLLAASPEFTKEETPEGKTRLTFQVTNVSLANFSGTIFADLYRVIGSTPVRELSIEEERDILPFQTIDMTVEFDYLSAGDYQLRLFNEKLGGAKNDGFATYNFNIAEKEEEPDAIREAAAPGATEAPYYTTGGIRQQQPTAAGVYIHGGKKEVVR